MKIKEIYKRKRPLLSFEIYPPKRNTELQNIDRTLQILADCHPDFISITFGAAGSTANNRTIELAKKIKKQYDINLLIHLTCINYRRDEIDDFIQQLTECGIENVLALRGDRNPDIPEKKDFLHASDLTRYLTDHTDFCIGGACYPEKHPESEDRVQDITNMKKKIDAGTDFLLTQLFFENDFFYAFRQNCRMAGITVPVSAGIMPVINKNQIERMVTLCGASLPEKFRKIITKYGDNKEALFEAGMSYAQSQIIDLIANDVDGIHLYTMNNPTVARRLTDGIKHII
ncbi:MAG: methylenetetrahydrofolate reductase [NAD(P)H] [Treponema sp.]|jgi:methylenetetrahydrofolate reductase (NADPH)|nr:methylenetetrahydrofolate reductase [NAD(P)H] [Treponema sp.]